MRVLQDLGVEILRSEVRDHELDLSRFDERFCNDETGAPAYPSAVLLKVILFADSRGIVSSHPIEQTCRENVVFMALSGDSALHFTTVASFIRPLGAEIADVFTQVLFLCDAQSLIGREMFAIDAVEAAEQCLQGRERHPRRVRAPGGQARRASPEDAGAPPRSR